MSMFRAGAPGTVLPLAMLSVALLLAGCGDSTPTAQAPAAPPAPAVTVSRLASGLPVGSDLEYADELTLGRAFTGRRRL